MNLQTLLDFISTQGSSIGMRVLIAVVLWIVGRKVIALATALFKRVMERNGAFDKTLIKYLVSIVKVLLTIGLLVGMLDIVGMQTASLAALIAGIGLAIGTSMGGLLTHFAAGAFLQLLRPFAVGDVVSAGGVVGVVRELGLFNTTILGGDNVIHIVANNKIFSENIQNFSAMPVRRVDCVCKIAYNVNAVDVIIRLREGLELVRNVKADPPAQIEVIALGCEGPTICVRPYAASENYWQVFVDTHKMILRVVAAGEFAQLEPQVAAQN
jgi:small conductance mechanosensitive channel